MAYKFKGPNRADPEYMSEPLPVSKCGTRPGYRQHQNRNEEPCDPCAEAHAEYMRAYMREHPLVPRHGTVSGHRAHLKATEKPCLDCVTAAASHVPVKRVRRKARKVWTPDRCGTPAGYRAHYYYGVPACDGCKEAQAVYSAGYRERQAA